MFLEYRGKVVDTRYNPCLSRHLYVNVWLANKEMRHACDSYNGAGQGLSGTLHGVVTAALNSSSLSPNRATIIRLRIITMSNG